MCKQIKTNFPGMPDLSSEFWYCDCEGASLHHRNTAYCPICRAERDYNPKSHYHADGTPRRRKQKFEITITETLERKIVVEANSIEEAEELVYKGYRNCTYVLDSGDFTGYKISA